MEIDEKTLLYLILGVAVLSLVIGVINFYTINELLASVPPVSGFR